MDFLGVILGLGLMWIIGFLYEISKALNRHNDLLEKQNKILKKEQE